MSTIKHDLLPGSRKSTKLKEAMSQAGICGDVSGGGRMKDKEFVAEVVVEPNDFVTVRAGVEGPFEPLAALECSGELPGNTRFAIGKKGWQFAAETRVNGVAHLPESFREIRTALRLGFAGRQSSDNCKGVKIDPADAVYRTIKESVWTEDQIVKTEHGWELQPRLAGETVPVAMRTGGNDALISCCVLSSLPADEVVVTTVAHQALLFNGRLRFVRLSVTDGRLVAETRLRVELINASWLEFAARAVASAVRGVTPAMTLIAHEQSVAAHYSDLILQT